MHFDSKVSQKQQDRVVFRGVGVSKKIWEPFAMADRSLVDRIVKAIQDMPELKGCRVGFQGSYGTGAPVSRSVFDGDKSSNNYSRCIVIIEELEVIDTTINNDTMRWAKAGTSPPSAPNPLIIENESNLKPELVGAGLSCGLAIVSVVGVVGSAAAEVPSAGGATFVLVASWTGAVTAGIQCLNSLGRVGLVYYDPRGTEVAQLDDNSYYSATMLIVDGLGLVSGVATLPAAGKNLYAIISRQRGFLACGLSEASLRQMNRAHRATVIAEIVRDASKTPDGLQAIVAAAREAGVGSASIQRGASLSVRNAARMVSVISDETARRLKQTILSILSVPAIFAVSAASTRDVGGASGSMNWIINLIDIAGGVST
jgi:hypothetical protein